MALEEFPHLKAALAGPIPDLIVAEWSEVAQEHSATGFYRSNLAFSRMYPYRGNELAAAVANTAPYAKVLEDGHGGYHLPSHIKWGESARAKTTKDGRRYLTIPFRHFTPGAAAGGLSTRRMAAMMPQDVYRDALTALRGERTKRAQAALGRLAQAGTRLSRPYGHHARTDARFPPALLQRAIKQEGKPGYTWRSRTYEGLRRYEQRNPLTGSKSSTYLTFRTLTEDSVGWYIPPHPGYQFAARTVERVREQLRTIVAEAAREDVVNLVTIHLGGRQ
jgi:hypothetical protein